MPYTQNNQPVVYVDEQQQHHINQIAQQVTLATGQLHTSEHVQPVSNLPVINTVDQQSLDHLTEEEERKSTSTLGAFLPFLLKSHGTSKSMQFLKKKMEWLSKKHGGEVRLK